MYKRRARILFLDPGYGVRAWLARSLVEQRGAAWIEPAAAALFPETGPAPVASNLSGLGPATPGGSRIPPWSERSAEAWDLVVALGEDTEWASHLAGVRHKVWKLERCALATEDAVDLECCREELRARVEGLLGGFRMKAREDGAPEGEG
jgi:hypothetical protein